MTKMDMVWLAVASLLHPRTEASAFVRRPQIDDKVKELFGETITPVMIEKHLVNSEDRQADHKNPSRGGSRNRYLVRDGTGRFRLYKQSDGESEWVGQVRPDPPVPR